MQSQRKPQFYILFMLVSFASVGAVIFTPALPALAKFFHISIPYSQLAVMFYLFGYALGELPYGPIANRFGRRKAIHTGASIAVLGCVICLLAGYLHLFVLLLVGLFIMAFGAAVGLGAALAIIADCYQGEQQTTLDALMFTSFAVMPAIAVVVGGFLVHYLNWQSCFYVFAVYAVLIFFSSSHLPHTSVAHDQQAFKLSHIIAAYKMPLTNLPFLCGAIIVAAATSFVYFYAAQAPLIGMVTIHLRPHEYGLFSLLPYFGMLTGSLASRKLTKWFGALGTIWLGFGVALVAALVMLISFMLGFVKIASLFLPMLVLFFTVPAIFANGAAIAFSYAKNKSNASAILNFVNIAFSFIGVFIFSIANIKSALVFPVALLIALIIIACLTLRLHLKT